METIITNEYRETGYRIMERLYKDEVQFTENLDLLPFKEYHMYTYFIDKLWIYAKHNKAFYAHENFNQLTEQILFENYDKPINFVNIVAFSLFGIGMFKHVENVYLRKKYNSDD